MHFNKIHVCICFILTIVVVHRGYCQPDKMPNTGTVTLKSEQNLTISLMDGRTQVIQKNKSLMFIRSSSIDLNSLKIGDHLTVIGFSENKRIHARVIVTSPMNNLQQPGKVPTKGRGNSHTGTITQKNPLAILSDSGATLFVETLPRTLVVQETSIDMSAITVGDQVRMLPGKIIVLSGLNHSNRPTGQFAKRPTGKKAFATYPPQPKSFTNETSSSAFPPQDTLLTDIEQQPISPAFIYGAWLGRGLYSKTELDRAFKLANNLGIRYLKIEFKWGYIEPENNSWKWRNDDFLNVEHVISLAQQYDFSIIPYFNIFMPWGQRRQIDPLNGDCDGPRSRWGQSSAPPPSEYAEYVFTVIDTLKRSGIRVEYAELDNEVSVMIDNTRSWNCFIDITPKQLKLVENMAYDRIKARYPEIMVSSTTFNSPGMSLQTPQDEINKFNNRLNKFITAYFTESPKPKFDFLGVHEIFHGSGNPFTTVTNQDENKGYSFSSYHDTYDIWRTILDDYGYRDTPIFVTESQVNHSGLQDVELLQKVIFARSKADSKNIRGWILSQLTGSKKFTEGNRQRNGNNKGPSSMQRRGRIDGAPGIAFDRSKSHQTAPRSATGKISVGIADLTEGYQLREGYYAFNTMMTTLARYSNYNKTVMGQLNSGLPWVEQFSDIDENLLYVAFIPWDMYQKNQKSTITLAVGTNKDVIITRSDGLKLTHTSDNTGNLSLEVTQHPVFIEVPGQTL